MGDGTTDQADAGAVREFEAEFSHAYATAGSYTVQIAATDDWGHTASRNHGIRAEWRKTLVELDTWLYFSQAANTSGLSVRFVNRTTGQDTTLAGTAGSVRGRVHHRDLELYVVDDNSELHRLRIDGSYW